MLATTRSGLPSPLTSATATEMGKSPWRRFAGRRRAVPRPASSCSAAPTPCWRLRLATTRSGLPSPLTSATATGTGECPVAKVCWAAKAPWAPGVVVFSSTDTVLSCFVGDDEVGLAVAVDVRHRHGEVGSDPGGEGLLGGEGRRGRRPASSCSAAPTPCWSLKLATTRSGLPSPLTSAVATELGRCPVAKVCWVAKGTRVAPRRRRVQQHRHRVAVVVGDDEVGLAVAVDVRHRHGGRESPPAKVCWVAKASRGRARRRRVQQHRHRVGAVVGDDEVGLAVAVDVPDRHGDRGSARGEGLLGGEGRRGGRPGVVVFSSTDTVLAP